MSRRATFVRDEQPKEQESTLFEEQEEVTSVKEEPKKKKEYAPTDLIPCVSITVGGLHLTGMKSGEVYHWTNLGEVTEVEYRDLLAEVRNHSFYVYDPAFIIQDEDFLSQHDDILVRYGRLYTPADIEQVLTLPAPQLEATIKKMPIGAQNAVKDLAVRKINSGELDSIARIKVIDSFFGTEMLLKLTR
jgi:hypothetical protein